MRLDQPAVNRNQENAQHQLHLYGHPITLWTPDIRGVHLFWSDAIAAVMPTRNSRTLLVLVPDVPETTETPERVRIQTERLSYITNCE
jgi:hypothetical protein